MKINLIAASMIILFIACKECKKDKQFGNSEQDTIEIVANLSIEAFHLEKENYKKRDVLEVPLFSVSNKSDISIRIKNLKVKIKRLSTRNASFRHEYTLAENNILKAGETLKIQPTDIWVIPEDAKGAYGIFIEYSIESENTIKYKLNEISGTEYKTFIRISEKPELNTFDIFRSDYFGLPVYQLTRGLSAECSIQKAAACLEAGISHSWSLPLASVNSTPQFLEESVKETVDFYNQNLGQDTQFETVVISTGIPSAIYLANTMKAPLLPLHFLVGAETVKEVKTILDYSNANGYPSYATLGHDYSISTTVGVAWIKLLDIPEAYISFIKDHNVKNIVFLGYSGGSAGEVQARKVLDKRGKYDPGSIYLMYFAGASAETYLRQTIRDFDEVQLAGMTTVADWESGIIPAQSDNFSRSIRKHTSVTDIRLVTSNSDIALWDLGTYLMLAYLDKNRDNYQKDNPMAGISLNPYLIGHPFYESRMGYVPFLYWQGIDSNHHIETRLSTVIKSAINHYFPDASFNELSFWVNSTNNFGGSSQGIEMAKALKNRGYSNVIENNFTIDETWSPEDGINSPVELRAKELLEKYSVNELMEWKENMQPLLPDDLQKLTQLFNQIELINK